MTSISSFDRTSSLSAIVSAALHAALLLFLGAGLQHKAEEVFTLQEISLVPAFEIGAPGVGGFRELTRPGGDASVPAQSDIKDPVKEVKPAAPQIEKAIEAKPVGPTVAERQKALKDKMQQIKDATRREFLKKGGDGPVVAREEAEALESGSALTGSGEGGPGGEGQGAEAGNSAPAAAGLGKGEGGAVLSGGIASRGLRKNPKPEYPAWAREKGIEGIVVLQITVLESGLIQPDAIRVIQTSGFRDMDLCVQQALRDWEFVPVAPGTGIQTGGITFRFQLVNEK